MTTKHCKLASFSPAQWTIVSKSKCFARRTLVTSSILLAISSVTPVLAASDPAAALTKIEPHLASIIAFGGDNEALIILSEQADLSGAVNLPTKLQKGIYVYNALRTVAERSQAPLRQSIGARPQRRRRGGQHQPRLLQQVRRSPLSGIIRLAVRSDPRRRQPQHSDQRLQHPL